MYFADVYAEAGRWVYIQSQINKRHSESRLLPSRYCVTFGSVGLPNRFDGGSFHYYIALWILNPQKFWGKNTTEYFSYNRSGKLFTVLDLCINCYCLLQYVCYITANESILYHYFPNSTLDYNSVTVELVDLSEPFYMYSIQVRGHMKSCDSYLGIHVYDKTSK